MRWRSAGGLFGFDRESSPLNISISICSKQIPDCFCEFARNCECSCLRIPTLLLVWSLGGCRLLQSYRRSLDCRFGSFENTPKDTGRRRYSKADRFAGNGLLLLRMFFVSLSTSAAVLRL